MGLVFWDKVTFSNANFSEEIRVRFIGVETRLFIFLDWLAVDEIVNREHMLNRVGVSFGGF